MNIRRLGRRRNIEEAAHLDVVEGREPERDGVVEHEARRPEEGAPFLQPSERGVKYAAYISE